MILVEIMDRCGWRGMGSRLLFRLGGRGGHCRRRHAGGGRTYSTASSAAPMTAADNPRPSGRRAYSSADQVLAEIRSLKHTNPEVDRLIQTYLVNLQKVRPQPIVQRGSSVHTVFVNNPLKMEYIDVIGLDYDYTLVNYKDKMESLIYDLAKTYMVDKCGYPADILKREYDPDFAIRGLAVDMSKGLLCKLSYIHQIAKRCVFRGRRLLTTEEVLKEYGGTMHVAPAYRDEHLKPLLDLFSLSEACLLADVIDYLVTNRILHDSRAVVEDVLKAIHNVHTSGAMHQAVLSDPSAYLMPAPHLRLTLQRFADAGKQLFLCSNSGFSYVDGGLTYLLGDDWRDMFGVVIVGAGKPTFYTSDRPFRAISPVTGKIQWTHVSCLEKGKVYTHGSLHALSELTGWKGPRVLYMGDSLWADLVDARKLKGWRTGAVIRELEGELRVQQSEAYRQRADSVIATTKLLRLIQQEMERSRYKESIGDAKAGVKKVGATCDYLPKAERRSRAVYSSEDVHVVRLLEEYHKQLNKEMSAMFSPFGSVFRSEGEPSLFAFSLRRYVDLYMSQVENLRFYSPNHRFFPERGISMPHDPKIFNPIAASIDSHATTT